MQDTYTKLSSTSLALPFSIDGVSSFFILETRFSDDLIYCK